MLERVHKPEGLLCVYVNQLWGIASETADHAFDFDPQRSFIFGLHCTLPVGVCFEDHAIDKLSIALLFI